MIAVMIRNAPAVTVSAARPRPQPRRSNAPDHRRECRRQDDRQDDRHHDQREHDREPDREREESGADEQSPAPLGDPIEPAGHDPDLGDRVPSGSRIATTGPHDGRHERHHRDRHEQADDAGDGRARGQGDEHDRGMDVDGLAVDDGPDDVVEDHVRDHDEDEQDERRLGTDRGIGDTEDDRWSRDRRRTG